MKKLIELSIDLNESINKLKIIVEKMNEKKEELKLKIQKIFTNIRNIVNNREDELLLEIDNKYHEKFIDENLYKEIEKLPNKIKISLEKGKLLNNEWDNDNKLHTLINNCINIENNIKDINILKEKIKKCNNNINSNIKFYPEEDKDINILMDQIKCFGKIEDDTILNICKISKIINNNMEYNLILKNWINPNENIKYELLYRLSEHGEQFSKFHELCDNKGPLLVLYHVKNGNKIGIYTPLTLINQNNSYWQNDKETFIFNLNESKKYQKINSDCSLYYDPSHGFYTAEFGNGTSCKSMKKVVHYANYINSYYEKGSEILPSNGKQAYYELVEVEVFKVSKI